MKLDSLGVMHNELFMFISTVTNRSDFPMQLHGKEKKQNSHSQNNIYDFLFSAAHKHKLYVKMAPLQLAITVIVFKRALKNYIFT